MEDKEIRVAQIISKTRVVLNVGSEDGIRENSDFLIYSISDEEIIDPVTGNSLGKLEYVKGKGHVIHLQEKLCTIETFEKGNGRRIIKRRNSLWAINGIETETEEIPSGELEEFTNVTVGDYAKLV